jgi:hypothetical protein
VKHPTLIFLAAFLVISTGDLDAKTFTVVYADASGPGSLRQAILDANASPNDSSGPDVIAFAITEDPGVKTISGTLPPITDAVMIDGYTQPGAKPNTNGPGQANNATLLIQISGPEIKCTASTTIRGLIINRSSRNGIYLANSTGHLITGNFIGFALTSVPNQDYSNAASGIELNNSTAQIGGTTPDLANIILGPKGVTIGGTGCAGSVLQGNVVSTVAISGAKGIQIGGSASGAGNRNVEYSGLVELTIGGGSSSDGESFPGTDSTDNVVEGNSMKSVKVRDGAHGNRIGGPLQAANIIAGGNPVVAVEGVGTSNNVFQGNKIQGIEFGTAVQLGGSGNNVVGGDSPGLGNVINGGYIGLEITSSNNVVQGNFVGTDETGKNEATVYGRYHNETAGLVVSSSDNLIGGASGTAGNVVSANAGYGIILNGSRNRVQGNFIGTDKTGTLPLGNSRAGVTGSGGKGNLVGGEARGEGNLIAFNGGGITGGVLARGNSIYANFGLGIEAGFSPLSPTIAATNFGTGVVTIQGNLNADANTLYVLDFVADPQSLTEIIPSFLGFANLTTDSNGHGEFQVTFPLPNSNVVINATASDPRMGTSAFSVRVARLLNISTRLAVQAGDNALIAGFILQNPRYIPNAGLELAIRTLGPSLSLSGVPADAVLKDPTLEIRDYLGGLYAFSDNWKDDPSQRSKLRENGFAPGNDLEAGYIGDFGAGELQTRTYTAIERGQNDGSGIGIIEAYSLSQGMVKLVNISTRGFVASGDNVMIAGFIVGDGTEPTRIVLRAIGPELTQRGVSNPLLDPSLEIHDSSGAVILSNDNWRSDQQAALEATGIAPANDAEAAIIGRFGPGAYTAIVRGSPGTSGVALVEVYNLP